MIENSRSIDRWATAILLCGLVFVLTPMAFVIVTATQSYEEFLRRNFSLIPGGHFAENLREVWTRTDLPRQTLNSIIVGAIAATGRIALAVTTSYAVVFFTGRGRGLVYALVVASIMLPLELMIITAYQVTANVALPLNALANAGGLWSALAGRPLDLQWNLLDSYAGIAIPLMAQGSCTLILVQFFRTIPPQLARAAIIDGAGPLRFLWDILLPLSKGPLTALGIYMFISAWIQYMWPLVAASSPARTMAVVGLARLQEEGERIPDFPLQMTGAILVTLPPLILIAVFQRRIVRGLTLSEK
ncbi:carbohydrate ABC transporter permease [Poseidonocella sp. HB161398]|uniref:carbohydrate ABC transporter permease n=1 Tax=Poseidonocella sp. HB161398 TaxID=2320855 RepID=UPI0011090B92|nr:ABC transporter permease subunit [Poseidonocella sp. HB161398]